MNEQAVILVCEKISLAIPRFPLFLWSPFLCWLLIGRFSCGANETYNIIMVEHLMQNRGVMIKMLCINVIILRILQSNNNGHNRLCYTVNFKTYDFQNIKTLSMF